MILRLKFTQLTLLAALCSGVSAFLSTHHERRWTTTRTTTTSLGQSSSSSDDNNDDSLESLRSMLEASWNAEIMGDIPKDPETAAQAAAASLKNAMTTTTNKHAFFLDLLFPPYDRSQGDHLYDEVSAVEFGIALANQLSSKSLILVPDQATVTSVQRVLDARQERDDDDDDIENEEEEDLEDDDQDEPIESTNEIEIYDDFADFGPIGSTTIEEEAAAPVDDDSPKIVDEDSTAPASSNDNEQSTADDNNDTSSTQSTPSISARKATSDDIDSFRQKLMSDWDTLPTTDDDAKATPPSQSANKSLSSSISKSKKISKKSTKRNTTANNNNNFRLGSLFGSATISQGIDMFGDVVQAIQENVQPLSTEQFLIVLTTENSPSHLVAIRRLLQQYTKPAFDDDDPPPKTVILVNCPLEDPLPRELIGAPTVYSLLPLVARAASPDRTPFQRGDDDTTATSSDPRPPKVAVLRRFPQDWQVFVDDGSTGTFELAASAPVGPPSMRRPPMQWISTVVAKFLQSRAQ